MTSKVYTIAPGADFLGLLALRLLREAREVGDARDLSSQCVFLPTRRSVGALEECLLKFSDEKALLLPQIVPLGDAGELEEETDFESYPTTNSMRNVLTNAERRFKLTSLVLHWSDRSKSRIAGSPMQAARLAAELGSLLDLAETEGVDLDRLNNLVPDPYAKNWQETLEFLKIIIEVWPKILNEDDYISEVSVRDGELRSIVMRWENTPPKSLVVAAGSTGSRPATASLLKCIASLPRGMVVLPGLDCEMEDPVWKKLDWEHPQYAMKRLLDGLEVGRKQVRVWEDGVGQETPARVSRQQLLRLAFYPAEMISRWQDALGENVDIRQIKSSLAGLNLLEAPSRREEAGTIALLLRDILETPGKRGALVTPDRELARWVCGEMSRWGIEIDDSAGNNLLGGEEMNFACLLGEMIANRMSPSSLLAVLKHPLARFGMDGEVLSRRVSLLERFVLRGLTPPPDVAGLRSALDRSLKRRPEREYNPPTKRQKNEIDKLIDALERWENRMLLARFGMDGEVLSRRVSLLERFVLRGLTLPPGVAGLRSALDRSLKRSPEREYDPPTKRQKNEIDKLIDALECWENRMLHDWIEKHLSALERSPANVSGETVKGFFVSLLHDGDDLPSTKRQKNEIDKLIDAWERSFDSFKSLHREKRKLRDWIGAHLSMLECSAAKGSCETVKEFFLSLLDDGDDLFPTKRQKNEIDKLIDALECSFDSFKSFHRGKRMLRDWIGAHLSALECSAAKGSGKTVKGFFASLLDDGDDLPHLSFVDYLGLIGYLAGTRPLTASRIGKHPRVFIWGLSEARLQRVDLLILGGLNEGVWPRHAHVGAWLNRAMLRELELNDPEWRIGHEAHDFVQGSMQPEVVLSRAVKIDGTPTVKSRWLLRLETLLRGMGIDHLGEDENFSKKWLKRFESLDGAGIPSTPYPPPSPRPQVSSRPKRFSVTRIERLIGDPYSIFASDILRLKPLDILEAPFDARRRGTFLHAIFEEFSRKWQSALPDDIEVEFLAIAEKHLAYLREAKPETVALLSPSLKVLARRFAKFERGRLDLSRHLLVEAKGQTSFMVDGKRHALRCYADRIEIIDGGGANICDYKSGVMPFAGEVHSGKKPQLSLEAWILRRGGFGDIEKGVSLVGLTYISTRAIESLGAELNVREIAPPNGKTFNEFAEESSQGMRRLLKAYLNEEQAYLCRPRREPRLYAGDYDHLARLLEWSSTTSDGEA